MKFLAIALLLISQVGLSRVSNTRISIYNNNCGGSVKVHVYDMNDTSCTNKWFTVSKGQTVTSNLYTYRATVFTNNDSSTQCTYKHEAEGTVGGKSDVRGITSVGSYQKVTCKKDWIGVCQCTK